jgi:hypothetical protein
VGDEQNGESVPATERERVLLVTLTEGRMALARAIGLLEAHWEVCADPFPDAALRRTLDRMQEVTDA